MASGAEKGRDSGLGAGIDALSEAIEAGSGLPAIARAAARALGCAVALVDSSSAVLAVAAGSSSEERKLVERAEGTGVAELRVADSVVGELRHRGAAEEVGPGLLRMVSALIALEVERARAPERASDEAARSFVEGALRRELDGPEEIEERARELGFDPSGGFGVIAVRVNPRSAQAGDWRSRALLLVTRTARAASSAALASELDLGSRGDAAELAAIVPVAEAERLARAAAEIERELGSGLGGFSVTVGHSRPLSGAAELYRGGREALLALNVADAEGGSPLDFERTGAYRLLLPALSEDPGELRRFYEETIEPLADYDTQYETELVKTADAYLANDGNITPTAETLFTHRHTIRYRLERIRELCEHDLTSTEGREKLGLGLKSMRVLGIPAPSGPAQEGR